MPAAVRENGNEDRWMRRFFSFLLLLRSSSSFYYISRLDSLFHFLLELILTYSSAFFLHSSRVILPSQKATLLPRKMAVSHLLSSTIIIHNVSLLSPTANDDNKCNWTREVKREREKETAAAVQQCIHMFDVSRCARNMDILIITIRRQKLVFPFDQGPPFFSFSWLGPFQSPTIRTAAMKNEY